MSPGIHDDPDDKGVFVRLWVLDLLENDYPTAILFNQLLWWHQPRENGRNKLTHVKDGHMWLLRADGEWQDARLTERQVRRARAILLGKGLIEHRKFRRDGAPTSAWRPIYDAIPVLDPPEPQPSTKVCTDAPRSVQSDAGTSVQSDAAASVPIPYPEYKEKELKTTPLPPTPVEAVFDAWRDAVSRPRSVLDQTRRKCIQRALRDGHSVETLIEAVRGWRHDPFYCGKNDRGVAYNELTLLLRNSGNIEKFSAMERGEGRPNLSANPNSRPIHQLIDTDRDEPGRVLRPDEY